MSLVQTEKVLLCLITFFAYTFPANEDHTYWLKLAAHDISEAQRVASVERVAENVILFVADGMGLTTTTAARIYARKEYGYLSFEKFPHMGTLKTYNADKLVPDSSSTATALFSGVKSNYKTSGVDSTVQLNDCEASLKREAQLDSLLLWAQKAGKATGFITTTRVTHATPSALYAHTPNRNWECENTVPQTAKKCKDIARQLIEDSPGKDINLIMGGGRQCLVSDARGQEHDPIDTWACYSTDGRNLIKDWETDKISRNKKYAMVNNTEQLQNLDLSKEFVLGIFANGHMSMDYARDRSPTGMPSLANMTEKAMNVLQNNHKGYVLVIEGGLIDYAHHRGHARQALDETVAFSNAIEEAVKNSDLDKTLIIVTSDHSHSLVFTGYPSRSDSVLDIAQQSVMDNMSYTSLLYGTGGPNNFQFTVSNGSVHRLDPSINDTSNFEYSQQAVVLSDEVAHGGADVLIYAIGPWAHLFHSVHEQTYVAYVISYAAKIGHFAEDTNRCHDVICNVKILVMCFISVFLIKTLVVEC